MPATLRGIYNYNIYPQPDFNAEQDQNGAWTARQSFIVSKTTWASAEWRSKFSIGTAITVINPTLAGFYSFLSVSSSSFTDDGGDIVTIEVSFSGTSWSQFNQDSISGNSPPTYRLEGRIGEQPLSEHPKWKELGDSEKSILQLLLSDELVWFFDSVFNNGWILAKRSGDDLVATDYVLSTGQAITFANMIADGIKTYVAPTITWTETTSGNSPMTSQQLNRLGKISNPRGNPPDASGARNWMLTGASQEQRGTLYQTQLEWTMSEQDGWNSFIYD